MTIVDYHEEVRTALFLSSVTLGTFIFTMKSFIIQTMKKEVYDNELYIKEKLPLKDLGEIKGVYEQLQFLASLLKWAIWLSFLSALMHITIGFFGETWSSIACILATAISWIIVAISIYFVSENLRLMIQYSERKVEANEKKDTHKNSECD